jgi:hypothetical protein
VCLWAVCVGVRGCGSVWECVYVYVSLSGVCECLCGVGVSLCGVCECLSGI